jgi:glycosyltransferase involved in cell wall biosynthesis
VAEPSPELRACFFARVKDPRLLDVVQFYRNDIQALRDLGFQTVVATTMAEIPWRADLYFTWWWGPGGLALLKSLPAGRPNVFTGALQLDPAVPWWGNLGPARRSIVRACLKLATANLAICDVEMRYLVQLGARRPERIYPSVDTVAYDVGRTPQRDRPRTFASISHLTAENVDRKRLTTVVRAIPAVLREYPDARFVIAGGHGPGHALLTSLAESLGVTHAVQFPGQLSPEAKIELLHSTRALVQPSIYEGFGVAQAEAMACALPVITSARGAVPEVVGETGYYAEPDDADALAGHMIAVLANPDEAQRRGALGRARVTSLFSYERRRDELKRVFDSVLGA